MNWIGFRGSDPMERHLHSLTTEHTRLVNRLETVSDQRVRASIERSMRHTEQEINRIKEQLREHVEHHTKLKRDVTFLCSITGIGNRTALAIMSEIPRIAQFDSARQVGAYAGLTPQQRQSGSSIPGQTHLSKVGSPRLRGALYMPALAAIRHNPIIKLSYIKLLKRGKTKMQAICAVMHRLIRIAYGVLKSQTPFDPEYLTTA